jgi:hypothetical protein
LFTKVWLNLERDENFKTICSNLSLVAWVVIGWKWCKYSCSLQEIREAAAVVSVPLAWGKIVVLFLGFLCFVFVFFAVRMYVCFALEKSLSFIHIND